MSDEFGYAVNFALKESTKSVNLLVFCFSHGNTTVSRTPSSWSGQHDVTGNKHPGRQDTFVEYR